MTIDVLYVYNNEKLITTKTVPQGLTAGGLLDHIKMLKGIHGEHVNVRTIPLIIK